MIQTVAEAHPILYHYTTGAGLQGIIESQQLRATNISFLNDVEEHVGYFDRRLPGLMDDAMQSVISDLKKSATGRKMLKKAGGVDKAMEYTRRLGRSIRKTTLTLNSPYVMSFCSAPPDQDPDDGLLSQWRGYGTDGSYAIAFDSRSLEQLLLAEGTSFHDQFAIWGDVRYYDKNDNLKGILPETVEQEKTIRETLARFFLEGGADNLDPLYHAITSLSCLHKHGGFREEREVRIVVLPASKDIYELGVKSGDKRPQKQIHLLTKNGIPTPYINLFGSTGGGATQKLPIQKVIVGPHLEKLKRQKAVQIMLEQHEISAEVVVSEIPYVGR